MPYLVDPAYPEKYDRLIAIIAANINDSQRPTQFLWVLRLILKIAYTTERYWPDNEAIGLLDCSAKEWCRRLEIPQSKWDLLPNAAEPDNSSAVEQAVMALHEAIGTDHELRAGHWGYVILKLAVTLVEKKVISIFFVLNCFDSAARVYYQTVVGPKEDLKVATRNQNPRVDIFAPLMGDG
ncbi:hypothetical protein JNK13_03170 [bacterium]|nr:hypothetical protein [bacterium]